MLVPIQTSGNRPPLFFVHGTHGVMTFGSALMRALGPQQPIYAIHAEGIDGRVPPIDNIRDMVSEYVRQIRETGVTGQIRIGGMCGGCTATIEVARDLQKSGIETGPVILVDPTAPVFETQKRAAAGPLRPEVAEQMYQWVRMFFLELTKYPGNDFPFDVHDANQLHIAALAGRSAAVANDKFVKTPFLGPIEVILAQTRAASFFHPQLQWRKLLPGLCAAYVLPSDHTELLSHGREGTIRLLRFIIEQGLIVENPVSASA
jgi:thioesterase domain-containing protein